MTMVRVKVSGYVMVPSYEDDDFLAQEDAAKQVEATLDDYELEDAEVEETEIISSERNTECNEDFLYNERRDTVWGDAA